MFHKKTIDDVELEGKTVLLRVEFNVPIVDGKVADDHRMVQSLPTLNKLLENNCRVIIMTKLGRPKGKVVPELSAAPVAEHLKTLVDAPVAFVDTQFGDRVAQAVKALEPGGILLLENLRFHPGEKANDPEFAKAIVDSVGADLMVQDSFGVAHREDASNVAVAHLLPSVAGYLLVEEVETISEVVSNPEQPVVAVVGGSKLETKLPILNNFLQIAQTIVIGGVMANTFLKAAGYNIGASVHEEGDLGAARSVMSAAEAAGVKILMPSAGVAVGNSFEEPGPRREVTLDGITDSDVILDYGQAAITDLTNALDGAKTIIWNGPLGVTEYDDFAVGSRALADYIADRGIYTVVGGGDTVGYIDKIGYVDKFAHVSTGGGASLEVMAGNKLPAVEVLIDR